MTVPLKTTERGSTGQGIPVTIPEELLRTMMQRLMQEMLEVEFTRLLGALPHERTPARRGYRNGTRERTLVTRVGKLTLRVPRDRAGTFQPALFARYQRSEQALVLTLAEMYVQGVSTRKVSAIVEQLCGATVSASTVSACAKRLDASLAAWRARRLDAPLEAPVPERLTSRPTGRPRGRYSRPRPDARPSGHTARTYPYLIIDAHYERIRRAGQVVSTAALWVIGVRADGYREHLGLWLGPSESATSWRAVCQDLLRRGLTGVRYVVSDEHEGLVSALRRYFPDAVHQRCQVHYLRNALGKVGASPTLALLVRDGLRDVWTAPTRAAAEARARALTAALQGEAPELARWLEDTVDETLAVYLIPTFQARRRLATTNAIEHDHAEVRRRTRVIRIFPNPASFLRLGTALAIERTEQWATRRYLIPEKDPYVPVHRILA
ncbi:MAG: IS256 family transposase, partial [Gaiellaceae bacterium]